NDPRKLKEYITSLYKAFKDKSKGLRSAYSKLDLLNNEIAQEKTRLADIEDENRSLREQMQAMADQLAAKEEEFNEWQEKLVEQTRREHEVLVEEMNLEREHFNERINQLEDALNLANLEISRLTMELTDLNDSQKKSRRGSSSTNGSRSSVEITFGEKVHLISSFAKKDDRNELTKQILEITQRRMSLQTELTLLEETNEELK
ncbi:9945_t:CDS:2, partial [Acaulospora colombiana]